MKPCIFLFVTLAAIAAPAAGQVPVGTRVGEPMTGYDDGGRRDPFASLMITTRPAPGQPAGGGRPGTGLSSFSVSDVTVTGIITAGHQRMAILQGPDRTSYVARIGARILDAAITSIDARGVVFVELMEPGATARPQEYRKTLRPAAEVIR